MPKGRLISFEGIDGAGKSTHLAWTVDRLRASGREVLLTREPGGTPLGERLRELLLAEKMSIEAETLLMFAARKEHLEQLIRPALARGAIVVCDRFTDSTYAYQSGGRGLPASRVAMLEQWVHGDLQPDRSFLFDLPPEVAAGRRAAARAADRFETEDLGFFERVRNAYRERAAAAPERFVVIDATESVEEIRNSLEQYLVSICNT
ncbi:MAG: dTMP kinase [Burkholderiaceae bacterium]|nr:dTMP kinase [Burkholderiaceae bacterium]